MNMRMTKISILVASILSSAAIAAPQGGTFNQGTGTININGTTIDVDLASKIAVIDWDSFNVASGETVNFTTSVPPSQNTVAINIDHQGAQSQIAGNINSSNVSVVVLNEKGVNLNGANINTKNGFIAAAGTLKSVEQPGDGSSTTTIQLSNAQMTFDDATNIVSTTSIMPKENSFVFETDGVAGSLPVISGLNATISGGGVIGGDAYINDSSINVIGDTQVVFGSKIYGGYNGDVMLPYFHMNIESGNVSFDNTVDVKNVIYLSSSSQLNINGVYHSNEWNPMYLTAERIVNNAEISTSNIAFDANEVVNNGRLSGKINKQIDFTFGIPWAPIENQWQEKSFVNHGAISANTSTGILSSFSGFSDLYNHGSIGDKASGDIVEILGVPNITNDSKMFVTIWGVNALNNAGEISGIFIGGLVTTDEFGNIITHTNRIENTGIIDVETVSDITQIDNSGSLSSSDVVRDLGVLHNQSTGTVTINKMTVGTVENHGLIQSSYEIGGVVTANSTQNTGTITQSGAVPGNSLVADSISNDGVINFGSPVVEPPVVEPPVVEPPVVEPPVVEPPVVEPPVVEPPVVEPPVVEPPVVEPPVVEPPVVEPPVVEPPQGTTKASVQVVFDDSKSGVTASGLTLQVGVGEQPGQLSNAKLNIE